MVYGVWYGSWRLIAAANYLEYKIATRDGDLSRPHPPRIPTNEFWDRVVSASLSASLSATDESDDGDGGDGGSNILDKWGRGGDNVVSLQNLLSVIRQRKLDAEREGDGGEETAIHDDGSCSGSGSDSFKLRS